MGGRSVGWFQNHAIGGFTYLVPVGRVFNL